MMKFKQQKKKRILCCLVDNLDQCTSGWAREVSINITDFLIHRFILRNYDVVIGKDENELLKLASEDSYYTHAVVIASGMSLGLSDRLFPAIESLCEQEFFIAGHVLHRNENSYWQNAYYELHHQFYIVKLSDYVELGQPNVGIQESIEHTQIEPLRSVEYMYDDHEVPVWVKPGTIPKQYSMKLHGWNIISTALAHNKQLIDLGSDVRDNKKYLYYEHDHVFLRQMSDIYYNQFFCNNFFAAWNSDQFKQAIPFVGPVEQYITVGIGVYWIDYLTRLGTTDNTRVVFTDINYNCLMFMKAMVEEWDGVDYADFYRKNIPQLPNNTFKDINAYIEMTRQQWQEFLVHHPNWQDIWAKIRKLKYDYILIDYMSTYNLNWIEPNRKTLLNLSDVFTHSPYIATQSLKYRISCENKLFNNLKSIDPNINVIMTSRASDGFHQVEHRTMAGPVGSFDLTDINELQKPVWHQQDWVSPRMLG